MKKFAFVFLVTFCISNMCSQSATYGVSLGGNFSTVTTDGSSLIVNAQDEFTTNFNFGAFVDHGISERLGVKVDLTYVRNEIVTFSASLFQDIKLGSLDLTPLLKFSLNEDYKQGFALLVGPRASFLLSAKDDGTDAKDAFKSTSFGIQVGALQTINDLLAVEFKVDYGFPLNEESVSGNKINIVSVFLSLNVNLNDLFNN